MRDEKLIQCVYKQPKSMKISLKKAKTFYLLISFVGILGLGLALVSLWTKITDPESLSLLEFLAFAATGISVAAFFPVLALWERHSAIRRRPSPLVKKDLKLIVLPDGKTIDASSYYQFWEIS
jgi:hypothetical protein